MTPDGQQDEEDNSPERARKRGRPTRESVKARILQKEFNRAESGRGDNSRFCGDLTRLKKHIKLAKHSLKHPKVCKVCGGDAYSMYQLCNVYLHFNPAKGKHAGKNCFHDYYDTCLFELVQSDNHIGDFKKRNGYFPQLQRQRKI